MNHLNPQLAALLVCAAVLLVGALVMTAQAGTPSIGIFRDLAPQAAGLSPSGHWHKPRGWARDWRMKLRDKVDHLLHGKANFGEADEPAGGGGGGTAKLDERIAKVLDQLNLKMGKVEAIEKDIASGKASHDKLTTEVAEVQKMMLEFRKLHISARSLTTRLPGHVSEACARHLGGLVLLAGLNQEKLVTDRQREFAEKQIREIFGVQQRTTLSTSDIPLPVDYGSEVVELVSTFGAARKYGTVFPLGSGSVKLPRLGTDPAFGLISAASGAGEKSPTIVFVTLAAEKYGGIVRFPSEIDEDSIVALGQFIARYAARQMAKVEDKVFFTGNGSTDGAVEGLTFSTITNSKVVQQASTKTKYSDITLANLRAIRAVVDSAALGLGRYYLHPTFESALSAMNSSGDKPYIANGIKGASLDGFPIEWVDIMPAYSTSVNASKVFVLFGDVSFQYLGVRGGIRFDTSKEVYFATDEIGVRALERFTIGLMAVGAVSGLQTAAS